MPARIVTHPWEFAFDPFRIAGRLYYVGNSNVSGHLIDTGEGLILLDSTYPQTLYLLLESIRRLGFDPQQIAYVLHCHGHYDHFGGTRGLVELTGAKTVLGQGDVEILESRPELSWAPQYGVEFHEVFDVDVTVADGDVISLGDTSIRCVHIPGHTAGAMSYFFDIAEGGRTYRAGIHGGPGINTLTDEYLDAYGLPLSRRDQYMQSLERLKQEKVDIFIGAHPAQNDTLSKAAAMSDTHNPFIDAEAWPKFVNNLARKAKAAFAAD